MLEHSPTKPLFCRWLKAASRDINSTELFPCPVCMTSGILQPKRDLPSTESPRCSLKAPFGGKMNDY